MKIILENTGKRYIREWIFSGITYTLEAPGKYAIMGPNGSGKSTLLQILSGFMTPTEGKIFFYQNDKKLAVDQVFRHVSLASPYTELIEEFTVLEAIKFHSSLKPLQKNIKPEYLFERLELPRRTADKFIRQCSSGMKQRVKLALAIMSDVSLIILDEPTVTLDKQGVDWFHRITEEFVDDNRLLIVASNVEDDFKFCKERLNILDYK